MAFDKVIDSAALNAGMAATANAIRVKTGRIDPIEWDSVNGFKEAVDQIDIKQGIELPVLGDASAKPTDMAFGKILYDDSGNPVVGTLVESKAGTNEMITATEFYGNSQGDTTFSFSGIYSVNHTDGVDPHGFICRPGTNFVLKNIPTALFGNATADQVAKGATFTSAAGLMVEGTMETGGGGQKTYFCKYSGAMYYPVMNIPDVIQGFAGPVFKDAVYLEELYAPNAQLDEPNEMGQECFSGCKALRIVYLPKATYFMHYNFRYCTSLNEVQFGSIGYPVTNIAVYTFNGVTQSGLTITVYVDAATLADIPTAVKNNAPWGATNANIIYRNSTTGEVITE